MSRCPLEDHQSIRNGPWHEPPCTYDPVAPWIRSTFNSMEGFILPHWQLSENLHPWFSSTSFSTFFLAAFDPGAPDTVVAGVLTELLCKEGRVCSQHGFVCWNVPWLGLWTENCRKFSSFVRSLNVTELRKFNHSKNLSRPKEFC